MSWHESAMKIRKEGFRLSQSRGNWCGSGVYFYDIKAKAWWSANRTCEEIKKKTGKKAKPEVVFADIRDVPKTEIFDLRIHKDLCDFEEETKKYLDKIRGKWKIEGIEDESERIIILRTLLIDYYAKNKMKKLVIGIFRQRPRKDYEHAIAFAGDFQIVFGVETIYCVKDPGIIRNIR